MKVQENAYNARAIVFSALQHHNVQPLFKGHMSAMDLSILAAVVALPVRQLLFANLAQP